MAPPTAPQAMSLSQSPRWGGCSPGTHLQDTAADVAVTGLALDAELGVVVGLAVRDAIPWERARGGGERPVSPSLHPQPRGQPGNAAGQGGGTHLLMYSPVRMMPHVWHLKQLTCHCFSRASRDWPCLISSLQPAQSGGTGGNVGHPQLLGHPGRVTWHSSHTPLIPCPAPITFPGMMLLQTPCS